MQFNLLDFWNQVQKEFLTSDSEHIYICCKSETFATAWKKEDEREGIIKQAKIFLSEFPQFEGIEEPFLPSTQNEKLFWLRRGTTTKQKLFEVRKEFIQWNINRLLIT